MSVSGQRFAGKRALVTGAGKGIGRAIALRLAEEGAKVICISRTESDLNTLRQLHPNIIETRAVDLGDVSATKEAVESVQPIDLLVNNAAVAINQPFLEADVSVFDTHMNVNVRSALVTAQICAKSMVSRGIGGAIVNISSQASMVALQNHTAYCTSKAALDMLTRMMAVELGQYKIRVNSVNPTVVMTDMGRMNWSDLAKSAQMLSRIPLQRFAEVNEIVEPILFLLSDDAAMITGAHLPIDGGFTST